MLQLVMTRPISYHFVHSPVTSCKLSKAVNMATVCSPVKIGTGIRMIPALVLTDSIAIRCWPVRGCSWVDRKDVESWVVQ